MKNIVLYFFTIYFAMSAHLHIKTIPNVKMFKGNVIICLFNFKTLKKCHFYTKSWIAKQTKQCYFNIVILNIIYCITFYIWDTKPNERAYFGINCFWNTLIINKVSIKNSSIVMYRFCSKQNKYFHLTGCWVNFTFHYVPSTNLREHAKEAAENPCHSS